MLRIISNYPPLAMKVPRSLLGDADQMFLVEQRRLAHFRQIAAMIMVAILVVVAVGFIYYRRDDRRRGTLSMVPVVQRGGLINGVEE